MTMVDLNEVLSLPWRPIYSQVSAYEAGEAETSLGKWALAATVIFTVAVFLLEGILDRRQKRAYQTTQFPAELAKTVSMIDSEDSTSSDNAANVAAAKDAGAGGGKKEIDTHKPILPQLKTKFAKSQAYGLDKVQFSIFSSSYEVFESISFLLLGFLPKAWDWSASIAESFDWNERDNEIKVTLIFLVVITLVGTVTSLPFEVYSTFFIEKKHGFNKQTVSLFTMDKIKSLFLTFLIGGPFVAGLLKIIIWGGEHFYLYVWAFMFAFSVIMMTAYPVFIMPMFNKYEPLDDGDLKTRIYDLAGTLKYPLTNLFVMDGSKRSSHSNAFMFGFGKNKRIVLFDTLIDQVHDDEILAILGHELGHWKLGHTLANFVITQLYTGAAFYCFSLCYTSQDLYRAFGFDGEDRPIPIIIALMLYFQTLWAPVDKVLSFVMTIFSRVNEFAADRFSAELGMSSKLQSGLCKIHLENLGAMAPDRWYSKYHYSHPPLVERLSAMMAFDKKSK